MTTLTVNNVAPGWEPVRDEFLSHLASGMDRGASVAVRHKGQLVVDLVGPGGVVLALGGVGDHGVAIGSSGKNSGPLSLYALMKARMAASSGVSR